MKAVAALRWTASLVCWIAAVISAILTGAGFVTGAVICSSGQAALCPPQTVQLIVGILMTLLFGGLATALWKPGPKVSSGKPWEYRQ